MDPNSVQSYFFTQGILGVMLFIVGSVFLWYYVNAEKDKKMLENDKRELNKLIFEQLNLRVEEQKTIGKDAVNTLKDNSQALYVFSEKIETNKAIARTQ